jgi:outer membrane cobalamin receptor
MRRLATLLFVASLLLGARLAHATIFGTVRGIVHDPQHRPVEGATITLKARLSEWVRTSKTNSDGEFGFSAVPVGEYSVKVEQAGFGPAEQSITVNSDSAPVLHFALTLAGVHQSTTVSAQAENASTESVTPTTLVSRRDIEFTPGADRSNSLQVITNYVPGAYFTHDQLHIRGGHQVSWLVDGVPVPNTNIASNVGPQFDPKDIDYLEIQRGSYEAEYGDRTYGVFNVVPRTGFERNNQGELIASFGNFYQTNDQVNIGGHTQRFAYYASLNGNRSNLGLQSPVAEIIHNRENGYGGFASLLFNLNSANQLRLVTSLRQDYYQIPNTPANQALGIRDGEHETDSFVNFSWVRTFSPGLLLTVSPFFHHNTANYEGGRNDFPISTTDDRRSSYAGGQATFNAVLARNEAQVGVYGFEQRDHQLFGLVFNDKSNPNFRNLENVDGNLEALFLEDKFKVARWLSLNGGVRQTYFSGSIVENATSPRVGASLGIPYLHWTLHGFYGHFYQAPPLITASGPLLQFVNSQNLGFIPLHGERDEEHQFGITIPWRGWTLDADTFRTRATNFFDHNSVGNSNIFFPLTINGALIRGWELTFRSPRMKNRGQLYLTYSNQIAEGVGAINGGLTNFSPPGGFFLLDHDQRNTLHVGGIVNIPWHGYASADLYYGSGFSNGSPPPSHLPGHTTVDLSLGKSFGESFGISINALNVANRHLLIDNSLTFGGTHFNDPREIYGQVRWRFHY